MARVFGLPGERNLLSPLDIFLGLDAVCAHAAYYARARKAS